MEGRIESVRAVDVEQAALLADQYAGLSARDLLHAAVMRRVGATTLVSADRGFDRIAGIERLDPSDVASWEEQLAP